MLGTENDFFQPISLPEFSVATVLKFRETPINNLIYRTERILRQYLDATIATSIHLTDKELTVMVDINQMEEVLVNLVGIAKAAMPDGGNLTIKTGEVAFNGLQEQYGRCGFLSVSDTGPARSFFPSSDTAEQALRLRKIHHIVDQHNGHTKTESRNGFGTTVFVYLPLVKGSIVKKMEAIPLGISSMMSTR